MASIGGSAAAEPAAPAPHDPVSRDAELVARLLDGDEDSFRDLVAGWGPGLLRVAGCYLRSRASAEEVVQETWVAVISGLTGFQGRSSLRTWVFRVLINTAKSHAQQEVRTVPVAELDDDCYCSPGPGSVFRQAGEAAAGRWTSVATPSPWHDAPEAATLAGEAWRALCEALLQLPERQRGVVTLHDVCGYSSQEICELLELSPANQRVLLHRARAALRDGLDAYYAERRAGAR